jgi:DNA polymerase delta subunit 1
VSIELVAKKIEDQEVPLLKIAYTVPCLNLQLNKIIRTKDLIPGVSFKREKILENNVDYEIKFLLDLNISGCCWIELPAKTWIPRKNNSTTQLELDVSYKKIISHKELPSSIIAPLRILSLDLECQNRKLDLLNHKKDQVLQIANIVTIQGEQEPYLRVIFTLNSCAPIAKCQVYSFQDEKELLRAWRNFVLELDPDILTGYNIVHFDLHYLFQRAEYLGIEEFPYFGRIKAVKTKIDATKNPKEIKMDGRIIFDVYEAIKNDFALDSYKLREVCAKFLNENKDDIHFTEIGELQRGDAQSRRKLALYCLKDAYLPMRLLHHFKYLENFIGHSQVTGIPISKLIRGGIEIENTVHNLKHSKSFELNQ